MTLDRSEKLVLLNRVRNMLKFREVTDELERLRRYIDGLDEASRPQANDRDDDLDQDE